uniref:Uncharacterized protein n=1 Tax=Knipowitschia caucasica TaxID=637954 RepID=A0AAV2JFD1_KNICA
MAPGKKKLGGKKQRGKKKKNPKNRRGAKPAKLVRRPGKKNHAKKKKTGPHPRPRTLFFLPPLAATQENPRGNEPQNRNPPEGPPPRGGPKPPTRKKSPAKRRSSKWGKFKCEPQKLGAGETGGQEAGQLGAGNARGARTTSPQAQNGEGEKPRQGDRAEVSPQKTLFLVLDKKTGGTGGHPPPAGWKGRTVGGCLQGGPGP